MSERRSILLATPSLDGKRKRATRLFVELAQTEAAGLGWEIEDHVRARDSIIAQARNAILGKFLAGDHTDLLWLDADVAAGPGAFARLMSHRVDFVCAVPRSKTAIERYPVRWLPDLGQWVDPATGLRQAEGVPFGLVRITRAVAERLRDAHIEQWFKLADADHKNWCIFDTEFRGNQYWGEDFVFCQRWLALGGAVHVDAEIPTQHIVSKAEVYAGHLGNFLRKNQLVPHALDEVAAQLSGPNPDGGAALRRVREILAGTPSIAETAPAASTPPGPPSGADYQQLFAAALNEFPPL